MTIVRTTNITYRRPILISCLLIFISACGTDKDQTKANEYSPAQVIDFSGQTIQLKAPAKRIIALAPHIVENAFSAGAGDKLVGVASYSNYPDAAKTLPVVSGYQSVNHERIIELKPDLIIAWQSGVSQSNVRKLKDLGFTVYIDQADTLTGVAKSIRDIGILSGTEKTANKTADNFLKRLQLKQKEYQNKKVVSAFYQVWNQPLQTINGTHIISNAIETCAGKNIFSNEFSLAPIVNIESILQRNPQTIIASGMSKSRPEWLDDWKKWSSLTAVKKDNLFFVNPDHIQRHTVRLLLGIDKICQQLDLARER